jgi:hypothetical protein
MSSRVSWVPNIASTTRTVQQRASLCPARATARQPANASSARPAGRATTPELAPSPSSATDARSDEAKNGFVVRDKKGERRPNEARRDSLSSSEPKGDAMTQESRRTSQRSKEGIRCHPASPKGDAMTQESRRTSQRSKEGIRCLRVSPRRGERRHKNRFEYARASEASRAEEKGFEPLVGCPTADFKSAALDHSATPPDAEVVAGSTSRRHGSSEKRP